MKRYLILIILATLTHQGITQTVDRSKAPLPLQARVAELGKSEKFILDNGLTVFVVTNNKLPRISWRLLIDQDPMFEGDKAGLSELFGEMLAAGTTDKDRKTINESVDFIGAGMDFLSDGMYAWSLSKHKETLLKLASEVLLSPSFPADELEKLKIKKLSELKTSENNPDAIAERASRSIRNGNHPYGESSNKATISNLTRDDFVNYYESFIRPDKAYLIVTGDISSEDARKLITQYFSDWKGVSLINKHYPSPEIPAKPLVAVIDKPGAVQSVVYVHYPVQLTPGDEDEITVSVMSTILGGSGFSGRLMKNLREDKAFTYGSYCSLVSDKHVGYFKAFASVRNEVTDSAVEEILYEMNRLRTEKVDSSELQLILNEMSGKFGRSLESPSTVAGFALNIARYNLPDDYYNRYLEKLNKITPEDVQRVAMEFLKPENVIIQVVGSKSDITEKLKRFSPDGVVTFYNTYGKPAAPEKPIPAGVTTQSVIENYISAIGGRKNLSKLKSLSTTGEMAIEGMPMKLTMKTIKSGGDKLLLEIKMGEQIMQKQIINGNKGHGSGMMGSKEMTAEEIAEMKGQIEIIAELGLLSNPDIKTQLTGIETINDRDCFRIEVTEKDGSKALHYYDMETHFKVRSQASMEGQKEGETILAITEYSDYQETNGLKFPRTISQNIGPQTFTVNITEVLVNPKLPKDTFIIKN